MITGDILLIQCPIPDDIFIIGNYNILLISYHIFMKKIILYISNNDFVK